MTSRTVDALPGLVPSPPPTLVPGVVPSPVAARSIPCPAASPGEPPWAPHLRTIGNVLASCSASTQPDLHQHLLATLPALDDPMLQLQTTSCTYQLLGLHADPPGCPTMVGLLQQALELLHRCRCTPAAADRRLADRDVTYARLADPMEAELSLLRVAAECVLAVQVVSQLRAPAAGGAEAAQGSTNRADTLQALLPVATGPACEALAAAMSLSVSGGTSIRLGIESCVAWSAADVCIRLLVLAAALPPPFAASLLPRLSEAGALPRVCAVLSDPLFWADDTPWAGSMQDLLRLTARCQKAESDARHSTSCGQPEAAARAALLATCGCLSVSAMVLSTPEVGALLLAVLTLWGGEERPEAAGSLRGAFRATQWWWDSQLVRIVVLPSTITHATNTINSSPTPAAMACLNLVGATAGDGHRPCSTHSPPATRTAPLPLPQHPPPTFGATAEQVAAVVAIAGRHSDVLEEALQLLRTLWASLSHLESGRAFVSVAQLAHIVVDVSLWFGSPASAVPGRQYLRAGRPDAAAAVTDAMVRLHVSDTWAAVAALRLLLLCSTPAQNRGSYGMDRLPWSWPLGTASWAGLHARGAWLLRSGVLISAEAVLRIVEHGGHGPSAFRCLELVDGPSLLAVNTAALQMGAPRGPAALAAAFGNLATLRKITRRIVAASAASCRPASAEAVAAAAHVHSQSDQGQTVVQTHVPSAMQAPALAEDTAQAHASESAAFGGAASAARTSRGAASKASSSQSSCDSSALCSTARSEEAPGSDEDPGSESSGDSADSARLVDCQDSAGSSPDTSEENDSHTSDEDDGRPPFQLFAGTSVLYQLFSHPLLQLHCDQKVPAALLLRRCALIQLLPVAVADAAAAHSVAMDAAGQDWRPLAKLPELLLAVIAAANAAGLAEVTAAAGGPRLLHKLLLSDSTSPSTSLFSAHLACLATVALMAAGEDSAWSACALAYGLPRVLTARLQDLSDRAETGQQYPELEVSITNILQPCSPALLATLWPVGAGSLRQVLQRAAAKMCEVQAALRLAADKEPVKRPSLDACMLHAATDNTQITQGLSLFGCWNPRCDNLTGLSEIALKTRTCGGCLHARYCSVACQRTGWRFGHKAACCSWRDGSDKSAGGDLGTTLEQALLQVQAEAKIMQTRTLRVVAVAARERADAAAAVAAADATTAAAATAAAARAAAAAAAAKLAEELAQAVAVGSAAAATAAQAAADAANSAAAVAEGEAGLVASDT